MPESTALNGDEPRAGRRGDDARERRLAGAGRAPQDDRLQAIAARSRGAAAGPAPSSVLLADELVQRLRAHPLGERRRGQCLAQRRARRAVHRTGTCPISLLRRLVQNQRGGDGHVEGLDWRTHRDVTPAHPPLPRHRLAAPRLRRRAESRPARADRASGSGVPWRGTVATIATPRGASETSIARRRRLPHGDGQPERAAHRAAQGLPAEGIRRPLDRDRRRWRRSRRRRG